MVINMLDARGLGLDETCAVIRQLVADQSGPGWSADQIANDESVMTAGVGMTSLEAVEFLVQLEKTFGVRLKDLNWWIYDTPSIRQVAQQVLDLLRQPDVQVR